MDAVIEGTVFILLAASESELVLTGRFVPLKQFSHPAPIHEGQALADLVEGAAGLAGAAAWAGSVIAAGAVILGACC